MTNIPKKAYWTYKGRSMSLQSWAVALGVKHSELRRTMLAIRELSRLPGEQCFEAAARHFEGSAR